MTTYAYARVSTQKQSLQKQIDNIKEYNSSAIIFEDKFIKNEINGRKEFKKLLKEVKTGDTIIFNSINNMNINVEECFELYKEFLSKQISLEFIQEPYLNTSIYIVLINEDYFNTVINTIIKQQIIIAFDKNKKNTKELQENITAGLKKAKKHGRVLGRREGTKVKTKKSIEAKKKIIEYSNDFNGTLKDSDVMKLTGLARNTYYKYKKELKEEYELI